MPAWIRSLVGWVRHAGGAVLAALALSLAVGSAQAEPVTLDSFELTRSDEGLALSFAARFELSKPIEEALQKGVPLFFVAQAEVFRDRWYWADKRLAQATRTWRLAFQPLTRKYRVTYGGLSQHYDSLPDALTAVTRSVNWKLVDASQLDDGKHYVEFSYQLDTTQLPRPMQIGIGGQSDWSFKVERTRRLN
ncbi:DUF4390 domain-containing protein [Piscinibacter gummiphilus]|uniref:DUF4390 domain-containing protein n=1 Tax=Piscinibacter gummiphilus TaxID=946333 RepID=A0ABZ0CT24_9BURK|nr:DUF4390 domain-containing protein [Piscinibacter gummiphilus]WOB08133.1 DUF4390 domain-containing protein [Piscinibacter gummiphilus]